MVEADRKAVLQGKLAANQFASADSIPADLSHQIDFLPGAQVLAVFSVLSFALILIFDLVPAVVAAFPEHDLYFSRYYGGSTVPLRLFVISFFIAFATAISAPWLVRLRFAADIVLPFLLVCAVIDLGNSIFLLATGVPLPLHTVGVASGLVGFLHFSGGLLRCADMPAPSTSTIRHRYKLGSLLTLVAVLSLATWMAITIAHWHLQAITTLQSIALLGGVSVGVFLLIPLLFLLLNLLAIVQNMVRHIPDFAPDITVIVPAYNEGPSIAAVVETIDASAGRYRGRVHLVVINNRSTDDTEERTREAFAASQNLDCRLVEENHPGKAWALNRGLSVVETDYFARVDADTLLDPDALALCFRHFGHEHVGAVGGLALPPGGGPYDGSRLIEILLKLGYDQVAFGAADIIFGVPGMFACYRTDAAREAGGFAPDMNGEDTDIALRIGEAGYRLMVDPSATFLSEVPRTYAHLREQRLRWFRSIFHTSARNRHLRKLGAASVRGHVIIPFMLANTARRAMTVPLLIFSINFVLLDADPRSTVQMVSVLALLLGAPAINAVIAILVNLRFEGLRYMPVYIVFRMIRAYLTLESMLSMSFNAYTRQTLGESDEVAGGGTGKAAIGIAGQTSSGTRAIDALPESQRSKL